MDVEDHQSRTEAVDPGDSVLVRAPAGSGKTTLLAQRYVKLLEIESIEPENIACLTFARKAADEMRRKIWDAIVRAANGTEADAHSGVSKYTRPGHSGRIKVQTIDGFQRSLVQGDSLLAGVMPRFRSRANQNHYYNVVGDAITPRSNAGNPHSQIEGNPVLKDWAYHSAREKIVNMLRRRDTWVPLVEKSDPEKHADDPGWIVLRWLHRIVKDLDKVFSLEREYDHIEISQAASKLLRRLGGASQLKKVLGYPIHHVLVDEVQDLSPSQFNFFSDLLTDCDAGRDEGHAVDKVETIFAVGDSMQAIYGFRGAGMEVLRRMFEGEAKTVAEIGNRTLKVKELSRNFRSTQKIVAGVDLLLQSRMTEKDRIHLGRTRLLKNVRGVDAKTGKCDEGLIVKVFDNEDDEAAWVARTMEEHLNKDSELAVLVRSRRQYRENVEPHLSASASIDLGFRHLDEQACVNDIMTLGRCIEDRDDQVSWLALMRSPLVGMNSSEIHEAHERSRGGIAPLYSLISNMAEVDACVPKLGAKFERFMVAYWRAQTEMRKMAARSWLERAWVRAGGGDIYSRRADIQSLERFLDLVEEVHGNARFCDWDELAARLGKIEGSGTSSVKVMTIHGAKGLEFDTVIVPFLTGMGTQVPRRDLVLVSRPEASEGGSDRVETSGGEGFAYYDDGNDVAPYKKQREAVTMRLMEEGRMLLYVAATRAKTKCWLSLTRPSAGDKKRPKLQKWSMAARLEVNGNQVKNFSDLNCLISKLGKSSVITVLEGPSDNANKQDSSEPTALDSDSELPAAEECTENTTGCTTVGKRTAKVRNLGLRSLSSTKTSESGTTGMRTNPALSAIGEIVHGQIGEMLSNRSVWEKVLFSEEWNMRCREELRRRMRFSEITDGDFDEAMNRINEHLCNVRCNPFMKRVGALAANRREGWTLELEKSFVTKGNCGRIEEYRVDMLLRNENQALILDFKTGTESEEHEEQLKGYHEVAKAAFAELRVASALYYTSNGLITVSSDEGGLISRLRPDEAT